MAIQTVAAEWQEYVDFVMPEGVSSIQYQEMRRAFYAGSISMAATYAAIVNLDGVTDEERRLYYVRILEELAAFNPAVSQGLA